MSYSRVPQKVDANQGEIVKALRKAGCSVRSTASIGDGFPDAIVGVNGHTFLLEIKNPEYRTKGDPGRDLSDAEIAFLASWRGGVVSVVYTEAEALAAVGLESAPRGAGGEK